jgi:thioredoxin-related protein
MAQTYDKAVFLKLLGNANMGCKGLFKQFKIRSTPSFLFFRNGEGGEVLCRIWSVTGTT